MRRNLAFASVICVLAFTASCVSPEELRRKDEARCARYGFQTDTPDFANVSSERASRGFTPLRRHRIGAIGASFGDRTVAAIAITIG
jgi:hypothetical protein